jgi:hypothetical protein
MSRLFWFGWTPLTKFTKRHHRSRFRESRANCGFHDSCSMGYETLSMALPQQQRRLRVI